MPYANVTSVIVSAPTWAETRFGSIAAAGRERLHLLGRDFGVVAHERRGPRQPVAVERRALELVEPEQVAVRDAVEQLPHRLGHARGLVGCRAGGREGLRD